jgi:hypothetical protein
MSDAKDPFGIEAFFEKVRNKDPQAVALVERVVAENAARNAGYKAGERAAFEKFPWPLVMLGGFVAWVAAGIWLVSLYPVLLVLGLGAAALWFTWTKKGRKPGISVAVVLLAVFGGLFYYDSIPPDHETRRVQMYRQDSTYCDRYASKREEARELLAWMWPKGSIEERMREESARARRDLDNLRSQLEGMATRSKADYACMLGQGWEKEWVVALAAREKARVEECNRRGRPLWLCR